MMPKHTNVTTLNNNSNKNTKLSYDFDKLTDGQKMEKEFRTQMFLLDNLKSITSHSDMSDGAKSVEEKTRIARYTTVNVITSIQAKREFEKLRQDENHDSIKALNESLKNIGYGPIDLNFTNDYTQINENFANLENQLRNEFIQKYKNEDVKATITVDARNASAKIDFITSYEGITKTITKDISSEKIVCPDVSNSELSVSEYLKTTTNTDYAARTTMRGNMRAVNALCKSKDYKQLNISNLTYKDLQKLTDQAKAGNKSLMPEEWKNFFFDKDNNVDIHKVNTIAGIARMKHMNEVQQLSDKAHRRNISAIENKLLYAAQGNDFADGYRQIATGKRLISSTIAMGNKANNFYHKRNENRLLNKMKDQDLTSKQSTKLKAKYEKLYGENGKITKRRENSYEARRNRRRLERQEAKNNKKIARQQRHEGRKVNKKIEYNRKNKRKKSNIDYNAVMNPKETALKKLTGHILKSISTGILKLLGPVIGAISGMFSALIGLFTPILIPLAGFIVVFLIFFLVCIASLMAFIGHAINNATLPESNTYTLMKYMESKGYNAVQIAAVAGNMEYRTLE